MSSTPLLDIDTLIIVACHAICTGGPTNGEDEAEWLIEPFQTGETPTFIEHIRRGVQELANTDGRGILVFSGGATKKLKTEGRIQRTEAEGYMDLAVRRGLFGLDTATKDSSSSLRHRMFKENYASDSYQNILLSLIQYPIWLRQQQTTLDPVNPTSFPPESLRRLQLPKRLIVISHEFKRARFTQLHLPAIGSIWPSSKAFQEMGIEYIGINPPFDEHKIREIEEGDRKRGFGVWKDDLYGTGKILAGKRKERSWDENLFLQYLGGSFDGATLDVVGEVIPGRKL